MNKNKNYILDDGKISECYSNIAQMSVLDYMKFKIINKKCYKYYCKDIITQYATGISFLFIAIINSILLIFSPIILLIRSYKTINKAKKSNE